MLRALYSSAAGMQSQQTNLDVISNNLANVNTTGYKKDKAEFQDLLYETSRAPGMAFFSRDSKNRRCSSGFIRAKFMR